MNQMTMLFSVDMCCIRDDDNYSISSFNSTKVEMSAHDWGNGKSEMHAPAKIKTQNQTFARSKIKDEFILDSTTLGGF